MPVVHPPIGEAPVVDDIWLLVPLEIALAGYRALPGFQCKEYRVRMVCTDIFCTTTKSLVPDNFLPAVLAFFGNAHDRE